MAVPDAVPIGLTDEFARDSLRQSLWLAFLKKNELPPEPLPADRGSVAICPGTRVEPSYSLNPGS